jgi:predicted nucleotidyltransferase
MSLVTDTDRAGLVARLRDLQPELRAQGVTRLAIFGSRARGDHRADSDLDILVDVAPSEKFSLLDLIGVCHTIEDSLGIHTNAVMRRSLAPEKVAEIGSDVVEVF